MQHKIWDLQLSALILLLLGNIHEYINLSLKYYKFYDVASDGKGENINGLSRQNAGLIMEICLSLKNMSDVEKI